jgi:hypothetical protein
MSYEIKLGYITGYNLVFTIFQPNGSGRGEPYQPLPELAEAYYGATAATDPVAGDEIVAYNAEFVTWEGEQVYVLAYDYIYWENDIVNYEGVLVRVGDETSLKVTSLGDVVGGQEFTVDIDFWGDFQDSLDSLTLVTGQGSSRQTIDESGLDAYGQPRQLSSSEVGYVPTYMKEV